MFLLLADCVVVFAFVLVFDCIGFNIVHIRYGFSSPLVILATSGILFFGLSFVCTAGHNI